MMVGDYEEEQTGGEERRVAEPQTGGANVPRARENYVKEWCARIAKAQDFFADDFKRMRECIRIARTGADSTWDERDQYTVAIINRHINQAVAQLYAKNPTPVVERKPKLWFRLFDGSMETAQAALMSATQGDPTSVAIIAEIQNAKTEMARLDAMARTCEILDEYYTSEQMHSYKLSLKHLVRRAKVTGVGYVKLGFQRVMGEGDPDPDRDAHIQDIRSKIERMQEIAACSEDLQEDSPEIEELRASLADLEAQKEVVVREGPVHSFLQSTQVIPDPACYHLRTFAGANWIAIPYDMTPERIAAVYKKDVKKAFAKYKAGSDKETMTARVYEVYDKVSQTVFTICEGYNDYLREPKRPAQYYDRFFPVFPLVFNETEHDPTDEKSSIFPPSDVWLARHAQQEYNRSREGLREHRIAARPWWVALKGALEQDGRTKVGNHAAHEVVELNLAASENIDVNRVLQRGPTAPIDPNLYETESVFSDVLRTVGSQEANIGGTTGATATESSIAEASRSAALESNIDDLDEFLAELAHARGQMYFKELSVETVAEIVGPGAVWPDVPSTREQVARDLSLSIKAGSAGRPNKAAKLANYERAMPYLLQMPNINPDPIARAYLDLLEIDTNEALVQGMPSVTALNAMVTGGGAQPGTGDPETDPSAQGASGGQNAQVPGAGNEGPQPAYPPGA